MRLSRGPRRVVADGHEDPPREAEAGQAPRRKTAAGRPSPRTPPPSRSPQAACRRHFLQQSPGAAERGRASSFPAAAPRPPAGLLPTRTPLGGRQPSQTRPRHRTVMSAGQALVRHPLCARRSALTGDSPRRPPDHTATSFPEGCPLRSQSPRNQREESGEGEGRVGPPKVSPFWLLFVSSLCGDRRPRWLEAGACLGSGVSPGSCRGPSRGQISPHQASPSHALGDGVETAPRGGMGIQTPSFPSIAWAVLGPGSLIPARS